MNKISLHNSIRKIFINCWIFLLVISGSNFNFAQDKTVRDKTPQNNSLKYDSAQPKFALLVGISKYKSDKITQIDGCQNNVPQLAETLSKDYGFGENILTLSNDQATKENIVKSFKTYLIDNAKKAKAEGKEAVIVYYFCGHGSQFKDQDGDESDGKDETFVAYDSRTGDVFDILDDELDDLKSELRPFTSNTTLIFESCHSGTGSRGDGEQYISEETNDDTRERPAYKRKFAPTSDADNLTYTELAASISSNTAKSESAEFCNCEKPMSLMTKALIQALKRATPTTTYRNLMRETSNEVSARSNQQPQAEGNIDSILFGGAAKRTTPYIEISKILPNNQIIVKAGAVHGIKKDSQVAVYSSESLTNHGDDHWLMNGFVNTVGNFESVVDLKPKDAKQIEDVKISSHVVLTSPLFGSGSILAALNPKNEKNLSTGEITLQKAVSDNLKKEGLIANQTVKLIDSDKIPAAEMEKSIGLVRLRKGKLTLLKNGLKVDGIILKPNLEYETLISRTSAKTTPRKLNVTGFLKPQSYCEGNALKTRSELERLPDDNAEVYYLDDGDAGGPPLFNRLFDPADKDLALKISEAIRSFTYQSMLKRLDNNASTLQTKMVVSLQNIQNIMVVCKEDGSFGKDPAQVIKPSDITPAVNGKIPINSIFRFNVKNISGEIAKKRDPFAGGESFYVAVIFLKADGDIEIVYQSKEKEMWEDGIAKNIGGYIAKNPTENQHLVVIVSKEYADFNFYQSKITPRDSTSPLVWLLTQSGSSSRSGGTISSEPDQWGVIHLDVNIVEK